MPQIDKRIPPRSDHSGAAPLGEIPQIIHQTFISTNLPEGTYKAAHSWIDQNPEFEYRFYDDADQVALIGDRFGDEVLAAYRKLPSGAFRADLWRYCALYEAGGVYADIDTVCQTSLNSVLKPDDIFVVPNAGTIRHAAFNAFICCRPGHPFLARVIEDATRTILKSDEIDGYAMVGPGGLGTAINRSIGAKATARHKIGAHGIGPMRYRIIEKCAAESGKPRRVESEGKIVLLTKYDEYLEDLRSIGLSHWAEEKHDDAPKRRGLKSLRRLMKRLKSNAA